MLRWNSNNSHKYRQSDMANDIDYIDDRMNKLKSTGKKARTNSHNNININININSRRRRMTIKSDGKLWACNMVFMFIEDKLKLLD